MELGEETSHHNRRLEWQQVPLSSLYYVKYGKANPGLPGEVPVIGSSGAYAWTVKPLILHPTIVVGRKGSAGQAWLVEEPSHPSDTTFYLEPRDIGKVDITFTYFSLRHSQISASDDVIPSLQRHELENLVLLLPPLPEQRAITSVLSKIQAAVEVQGKIVATLKELKAATMAKLFREGLRDERLKQTEIGEIPESWEIRELGDLADISTGTTPATDYSDYYVGDVPFVKTAEIDNNIITTSQQYISLKAVEDYNLRIYPAGSIFLAMYGQGKTRGRASLLGIPATTTQNTAAIEPGPELNGEFLWHYLLSQYEVLRNKGNLGHLSHLNLGYVKALVVPVPPKEQQIEIKQALSLLQHRIWTATKRHETLRSFSSSMLHLLMTGQVRVTGLMQVKG